MNVFAKLTRSELRLLLLLPTVLAGYRERGVPRRLSTTPVHPALLLAAQLLSGLLTAVAAVALLLAVARIVFTVPVPRQFRVATAYERGLLTPGGRPR